MTKQENGPPEMAGTAEAVLADVDGTLRAAERALRLAVEIFADLVEDARGGDIARDSDIRQAAGRLTGLQQTLLKELAKYEHETGQAAGNGRHAPIDFARIRLEIGGQLDRIRECGRPSCVPE